MSSSRAVAAKVAEAKRRRPEEFCPVPRCLWRTGGGRCPRHPPPRDRVRWESVDLFTFADGSVRLAWVTWEKSYAETGLPSERRAVAVRELDAFGPILSEMP